MNDKQMVLSPEFNIPRGVRPVTGQDGVGCLEFATHMTTLYWQTYGEHSRFFQAILDGRLIGARCPKCGMMLVPPMTWNCPDCDFVDMEEVELPFVGVLAHTAPITIFASASQYGKAPFCRGYVDVAVEASKASFMPARLETTTGLPRPGIFVRGAKLHLVFEDQREGRITDVFWVSLDEIPEELRGGFILGSQLNFAEPKAPELKTDPEMVPVFDETCELLWSMCPLVVRSPRAMKDIGEHNLHIGVKTSGGGFTLRVTPEGVDTVPFVIPKPDFVMQTEDPSVLAAWVKGGSLTDAVVEGRLWLPNRKAFAVLPLLDRLPRSIRRDREEGRLTPAP